MAPLFIFVTQWIWDDIRRQLEHLGIVEVWDKPTPIPLNALLQQITHASALLCGAEDRINRNVIETGAGHLRVISTTATNVDHIDVVAAAEYGIAVYHASGVAVESTADLTMALLLACARRIIDADKYVKELRWHKWSPELFAGVHVQGSTLGIIGLGQIGLEVAHRALGFGMRVLYYDIRRNPEAEQRLGLQYGELDDLIQEADFITLHVPLLPSTVGLIDEKRLRLMKPQAFLINTAHGQIIDHDALVHALQERQIAGAALDVFGQEPLAEDDMLLELSNVVLTPHISANTCAGIMARMRTAASHIIEELEERPPEDRREQDQRRAG